MKRVVEVYPCRRSRRRSRVSSTDLEQRQAAAPGLPAATRCNFDVCLICMRTRLFVLAFCVRFLIFTLIYCSLHSFAQDPDLCSRRAFSNFFTIWTWTGVRFARLSTSTAGSTYSSCERPFEFVLFREGDPFHRDLAGDIGFSGGFETMRDGYDKEGWMEMVSTMRWSIPPAR